MTNLNVLEICQTLMGESSAQGYPCTIIRLAGCNLECTYCDTPHKNDPGLSMSVSEIIEAVKAFPHKRPFILITGGEPFLQLEGVRYLVDELLNYKNDTGNIDVFIETNGTVDFTSLPHNTLVHKVMDLKGPSSGAMLPPHWLNLNCLQIQDELKFVIDPTSDADKAFVATVLAQMPRVMGNVVVSPILRWATPHLELNANALTELANWVLGLNQPVRLQLQLHKLLGIA